MQEIEKSCFWSENDCYIIESEARLLQVFCRDVTTNTDALES